MFLITYRIRLHEVVQETFELFKFDTVKRWKTELLFQTDVSKLGFSYLLNCCLNMLLLSRLREISDIAKRQVDFLNSQQQSREKEVESLRMQLLDFQVHIVLTPLLGCCSLSSPETLLYEECCADVRAAVKCSSCWLGLQRIFSI